MNISTLAKTLGISIKELRDVGQKNQIYGFSGRNTRIPYNSALEITKVLRPEKLEKLKNDDKIYLPASIKVGDFAETIGKPSGMVVKTLLMNGVMATLNENIDYDTASLIAEELRVEVFPENSEMFDKQIESHNQLIKSVEYEGDESLKTYVSRPPVVTIMGHVDHGKTTLLDYIRKSNVAGGEAGAITQHISSYQITHKDKKVTFVDTPGHEAFTAMRARGSQLADFVVLVVSATEGAKPQTVEVIERSKLSKVPVIVAMNKIDLPEADIERVKADIAKFGLTPEEWGGDTPFIPLSAKTGEGVDKLLETILLHAEVADFKGEVNCPGQGVVIESYLDNSLGIISTVLVTKESLNMGDVIRAGEYVGKIKKLTSTSGKPKQKAELGEPVMLVGIPNIVDIGEPIVVYKNQRQAQVDASIESNKRAQRQVSAHRSTPGNKDEKTVNLVLIADVSGSLEALKESIIKIPQEHAKIVIKREVVGKVNEKDVEFAETSSSAIMAFHTEINPKAENLLKKVEIDIVKSDIIYEILEWVEEEVLRHIKHEIKTVVLGRAKVLATFKADKPTIQVFGGEVESGKILDNKNLQIVRDEEVLGRVEIQELQRDKVRAHEINIKQQFGVSVTGKVKIKVGDYIESIDEQVIK